MTGATATVPGGHALIFPRQENRCTAQRADGGRCARWTTEANQRCRQHGGRSPPGVSYTTYVYVIGGGDLVKIGVAMNPNSRLTELQCGSPVRLEILAVAPADASDERAIHQRLSKKRRHGEWFHLDMNDLKTVNDVLAERHADRIRDARDNWPGAPMDEVTCSDCGEQVNAMLAEWCDCCGDLLCVDCDD